MRRDDVSDLFRRIPSADHARVQMIMRYGKPFSIEVIVRMEETYLIVRGRESGNQDEGRVFIVPYEEIIGLRLERAVKLSEVDDWFSDKPQQLVSRPASDESLVETPVAEDDASLDPAEIARQNLLKRIRAAKSVGKPTK
jgi:hypothetical protein